VISPAESLRPSRRRAQETPQPDRGRRRFQVAPASVLRRRGPFASKCPRPSARDLCPATYNATNTAMVLAGTNARFLPVNASAPPIRSCAWRCRSSSPARGVFQTCIACMSPVSAVPFSGDCFPCAWHRAAWYGSFTRNHSQSASGTDELNPNRSRHCTGAGAHRSAPCRAIEDSSCIHARGGVLQDRRNGI